MQKLRGVLLLPYHLGRMTTYVGLASATYSLVNLAFLFSGAKALLSAPLLFLAGIVFLANAFPGIARIFPWALGMRLSVPYRYTERLSTQLMRAPGVFKRYMLGVLLGFMPCGLVISALMAASAAPDILHAAAAMGAFTAGTAPALILVALGGRSLGVRYPEITRRITQGAMVLSSLWLFLLAGEMVF